MLNLFRKLTIKDIEGIMAQTTFANTGGIAHKGSGGISVVFPDVCKTHVAPAVVPTYKAVNRLGLMTAADMKKSVAPVHDGIPLIDVILASWSLMKADCVV